MIAEKNTAPAAWSGFIMIICITGIGALSLAGCRTVVYSEDYSHLMEIVNLDDDEDIYEDVDEMPRFPGCEEKNLPEDQRLNCANQKMLFFIYSNIKYPKEARKRGIDGTVMVSFIVERTGQIQNPQIVRGTDENLGKAALRVINMMVDMEEKWTPGIKDGKAVNVQYKMPIRFSMN